ncbi:MAG: MBL fold metallo-hydrolase [Bacteroidetes bacterium HGW-Bacteroidetes-17]|nr:MAG: MBL fold metallo-hydrolase [Bacteroidetes bacterium HGW-Bacteroidetes-17]
MKDKKILNVSKDVKWIGVLDFDIVTFDVVMETKYGTTYNSYFINAEKKTIVETAKEKFWDVYLAKIKEVVDPDEIEYIIVNHTEPDHSGNLKNLLKIAPKAKVVGSGNAIRYLKDLMGIEFPHLIVKDGQSLDLGNKTLNFIGAPNLHWPDSIYTYLVEDQLLFTCDSFGSHYCDDEMFDDQVGDFDDAFRYYFDVILKPFSKYMLKAIDKIRPLSINAICTGHGPILRSHWKKYVDLSEEIAKIAIQEPDSNRVFIPYVSAYHKTGILAESIAKGIRMAGEIEVDVMDVESTPIGELDAKIANSRGIIVGCPTINQNILLPIYKLFAVISPIRDKSKLAGGFGSYGWSGEGKELIKTNLENLKLDYFEAGLFVKFTPTEEELKKAEEYGMAFGKKLLAK